MTVRTWTGDSVTIKVDYDSCKGHGDCATSCPADVYDLTDGKTVPARIDDCIECCTCVSACPEAAITHSACD